MSLRILSLPRAAIALLALAAWPRAEGKVWIVGPGACPLVDFANIQPAIDASSDGDAIVVRPPLPDAKYAPFTIDGKSLSVIADGDAPFFSDISTVGSPITVRNLAAGQSVFLRGFRASVLPALNPGLLVSSALGSVWVEDCAFGGTAAFAQFPPVRVLGGVSVVLARCTIQGPTGYGPFGLTPQNGMRVENSRAHLYECEIRGGQGLSGTFGSTWAVPGGPGADGLVIGAAGFVLASGSLIVGGIGGSGVTVFGSCSSGGLGGEGLVLESTASECHLLGTPVLPGPAGPGGLGCSSGSPGIAISGPGAGSVELLPGSARSLEVTPILVAEGQVASLAVAGEPGDIGFVAFHFDQSHLYLPPFGGTLAVAWPAATLPLGLLPASGTLSTSAFVPPGLVGPGLAQPIYAQVGVLSGSQIFLGSPSAILVLDASYDPFDGCTPGAVLHVDDDAPGDPAPGNSTVSDPSEDGSPLHPYDAIQEAIDHSIAGNTILVEDGLYQGHGNVRLDFHGRAITLRGANGAENCVLQSVPGKPGFSFHSSETPASIVEGLTVTGGSSGMQCTGSSPTVRRCLFRQNSFGGLYCTNNASPLVETCQFRHNSAANGGGVYFDGSDLILRDCVIADNIATSSGGGIYALIANSVELHGCTLAGNSAGFSGGAVYAQQSNVTLAGSILWANTAATGSQVYLTAGASLKASFCDVAGGVAGIGVLSGTVAWGPGNFDLDPLFAAPASGDYHLTANSPCIDAGDPAFAPVPAETDFDGEERVFGAAVDVGADEWHDCNGNGLSDLDDIASGASLDADGDLIPDECHP